MYLGLRSGTPLPPAYYRVMVCERMGWTLDEFDGITTHDLAEILAVWDGVAKAEKKHG